MLKQKAFLSLIMSTFQQLIGYISLYFVARYMGPEPLGIISAAMAFSIIFMEFAGLGYGIAHVKKVSEGKDLGKCIGTFAVVKSILVTFVGLICFLTILYLKRSNQLLPVPEEYISVMFIMLAVSMIGGYSTIAQVTFAARLEKAKEWSSSISAKFITSLLKAGVAISGLGVIFLAWSALAGSFVGAVIAFLFIIKLPIKKFDFDLFKEYTRYALPAFIVTLSSSIGTQLDILILSILSNVEQVGYYSGAKAIASVIMFINVIFISLLLPTYSRLHVENNIEGIRNFAKRLERYISFPLVPVGMFIFFFSTPIQQILLGGDFEPSSVVIKILIINSMLLMFAQPYTAQLMGMNKIMLATILSILYLLLNTIFYFILIPENIFNFSLLGLGAAGAALALFISTLITTSIRVIFKSCVNIFPLWGGK
jgi:O-antigen/teichoic acid export membrane protein